MRQACRCFNCITPPHLLQKLLESKDEDIRQRALNTLLATAQLRGERSVRGTLATAPANGRRTIFDNRNGTDLSDAAVARSEDGPASADDAVNRAFDGFGTTRAFYKEVFGRDSIDDLGMRLEGYVHHGLDYNNAFWDGQRMVFGDGDGRVFVDFTLSLDVIAHELAHGVTEFTGRLEYHKQPGALNESMSDVFGSLVKQWSLGQSAEEADWLIGADIFTPDIGADAMRSLKSPGQAYNNDLMGRDPQPDHMNKFRMLPDTAAGDWGGVHINSGIPNKAFYVAAAEIGGFAWEAPGQIWYESLKACSVKTQFQDFANITFTKADELFGAGSREQQAVLTAWREVGVRVSGTLAGAGSPRGRQAPGKARQSGDAEGLGALIKRMDALAEQVQALAKEVGSLKGKR